ncbi:MAG: hypothetical protein ABEI99_09165 [Halobaculum sp.]
MSDAENGSVPLWWILVFLLLTLGGGAYAVLSVGGSLIDAAGVLVPLL